jgi:hypothetical protein
MADQLRDVHGVPDPSDFFSPTHTHLAGLLGARIVMNLSERWGRAYP